MLTLPASVQIYLATQPVDLRKSIDGLAAMVRAQGHDVYSGHLYAFVSRCRDRVKILSWDRGGFVLYYKRLECGRFRFPEVSQDAQEVSLDGTKLAMLLDGIDVKRVPMPKRWVPPK